MKMLCFSDIVGKTLLIGLTYYSAEDEVIERRQLWGTVTEANKSHIQVKQNNGEIFSLPPDLSAIEKAPLGEYRLHSTGEVVVNPDFLTTLSITEPRK